MDNKRSSLIDDCQNPMTTETTVTTTTIEIIDFFSDKISLYQLKKCIGQLSQYSPKEMCDLLFHYLTFDIQLFDFLHEYVNKNITQFPAIYEIITHYCPKHYKYDKVCLIASLMGNLNVLGNSIFYSLEEENDIKGYLKMAVVGNKLNVLRWINNNVTNISLFTNEMIDDNIYMICFNDADELLGWLLRHQISNKEIYRVTDDVISSFFVTVENGNLEMTKKIVTRYKNINVTMQHDKAFYIACVNGDIKMSMWLWMIGAGVECLDTGCMCILYKVVEFGNKDMVKWLMSIINKELLISTVLKHCSEIAETCGHHELKRWIDTL